MQITDIKEKWGVRIDASLNELLATDIDFIRNIAYKKHLVLFKGLGNISNEDLHKLMSRFGKPWDTSDYNYSNEIAININQNNSSSSAVSRFSNINNRMGNMSMPWHSDIPLWQGKEFPWRCLYNVKNDNPDAGFTNWLSVMLNHIVPDEEELDLYSRIKVLHQSWHGHDDENYLKDFIKEDPVTGEKSLRANYFVSPQWGEKAWIKETFVDDKKVDNLETLGKIYKRLSSRQDLVYTHQWSQFDCIIYNNWSFMHNRTALNLQPNQERVFIRGNISHLTDKDWDQSKYN